LKKKKRFGYQNNYTIYINKLFSTMSSIPVLPAFPPLMFQQNEPQKTQYVSKPFKCMTCLRSFRRMEHLNRHILSNYMNIYYIYIYIFLMI